MKKEKEESNQVVRHKVDITQVGRLFIVSIDDLPLNRKGTNVQATFVTSMDAYDAAERAIARQRE